MNLALTTQRKHQQDKNKQQAREMYLFKHSGTGSVYLMGANVLKPNTPRGHFLTVEIKNIGRDVYFLLGTQRTKFDEFGQKRADGPSTPVPSPGIPAPPL